MQATQPELDFGERVIVIARRNDPETSHEAAAALEANQEQAQRSVRTVLRILQEHGTMTDFQLADLWPQYWDGPYSPHLPRNARHWARRAGFVKHAGFGRHLNRRARTWTLGYDREFMADASPKTERCPHCGEAIP
jgi:hypothetical protein